KISNLKFENFKCFKNIELELGKLTLLTGANSSGKSSIIYGILGSLQSGEFPFQFSPNGKYIEMGDFQEISNNRDKNNIIKISYTISNSISYTIETEWEIDKVRKLPLLKSLIVDTIFFNLQIIKTKNYTFKFKYIAEKDPKKDIYNNEFANKLLDILNENINIIRKDNGKSENKTFQEVKTKFQDSKPYTEFSFNELSELNDIYLIEKGGFVLKQAYDSVVEIFKEIDIKTNYISSFRLHPDRTYYEQTKTDLKVGKFGERYTDQIVLWETKKSKKYKELVNKLNEINLLKDIKTKRLEGGRYELLVRPQENGQLCSLADVGFGISQFLPILVADFQLGNNSFLFVSQPEIHLHPSVQANFADYVISQIKTSKKSYIIETHSEYLINRIRLGIVKEEISDNDIKTYYFRNNGDNVENFPLLLTKDGQIQNAPEDFFKTYMIDVMDIAINSAK
ncbi:MAG: hypothetical protein A2046_08590, partial [Bacteroidetes bacterium GWA2_30_7]